MLKLKRKKNDTVKYNISILKILRKCDADWFGIKKSTLLNNKNQFLKQKT
jgi:hypothetical protein